MRLLPCDGALTNLGMTVFIFGFKNETENHLVCHLSAPTVDKEARRINLL